MMKKILISAVCLAVIIFVPLLLQSQGNDFNIKNLITPITIANGGTGKATATLGFDALSPLTKNGDVIIYDSNNNNVRLAVGAAGTALLGGTTPSYGYQILNVDTAAQGYLMFPIESVTPFWNGYTAVMDATAGRLSTVKICIKGRYVISNASAYIVTGADYVGLGVYNSGGTAKLFDTGMLLHAGGLVTKTGLIATLEPGCYILAWGSPNAASAATISGTFGGSGVVSAILNANADAQVGWSANPMTGLGTPSTAAFPTALGVITATSIANFPYMVCKP